MKHVLIASMLLILASHQATAQGEPSQRAYLGVQLQEGALVGNVDNNGPAQASGIEPGDLIVRFDGKDIRRSDDLLQIVADTPIGKEVAVTVLRGGKEGMTTLKLGQRLVLSGTALDAYRQKLSGMQQELGSLAALKGSWGQAELQRFSELFEQFQELKKAIPPEDSAVQNLWSQLEREFRIYKALADSMVRQREAQRQAQANQPTGLERQIGQIEGQLGPLYANYMTLQVCAARFPQFDNARSGLRDFLKDKESAFPRELTDRLWNAVAEQFQKVEVALNAASDAQLNAECEQASKKTTQEPPLRKKDF